MITRMFFFLFIGFFMFIHSYIQNYSSKMLLPILIVYSPFIIE